ncbi:3-methylcrotonyl-CoA carboxylase [Microbulbifer flavimaris]|uniref:3-methylcrotonyl-CoA carboxylase n=1 Tax=Microbulbifer flavimaris TaxID=1781068 RepID=A0ABX4I4I7_9GAMM|nr:MULTISPECIES: biotin carboxylase N-terminal domain-containing protein [Microbulbifer]KUJ84605.1 3-methylcrotonyl-CoA carboxylase [Microbulbifer sp. ZGT114]PCO06693.1 3-methylcrotonyl-CoA carboxylase [Microbulbifer flavimaris]
MQAQRNLPRGLKGDRPTLLIANRGEIAVRIIRTARSLGYRTVAIYSDADRDSPHVALADSAIAIGGRTPAESYLNVERLIAAAGTSGADLVHPGYGFLSENAEFARACIEQGLVFVGPGPEIIETMGNKRRAKSVAESAGVAGIPGYSGSQEDDALLDAAREIGFPVMVKAADGGGGRGMRLAENADSLPHQLQSARSEARAAFGSDELILEKAIFSGRHIEVQVFADTHGNAVHLGERDCSLQRRHQKIIEECPSPAVDAGLRARLGAAAVAIVRACQYVGAGTVEFLLDREGNFYFLEMNTRLQVEHPVTEMVSGFDLVAWQLAICRGETLPASQKEIDQRLSTGGHAIEARLYAEDPGQDFLPQSGRILHWHPPTGEGIRVDSGIRTGQEITPFYDPMLGKLIAWGANREQARLRLLAALQSASFVGPGNNFAFLRDLAEQSVFVSGEVTTDFLDRNPVSAAPTPTPELLAVATALLHDNGIREQDRLSHRNNWRSASDTTPLPYRLQLGTETYDGLLWPEQTGGYRIVLEGRQVSVTVNREEPEEQLQRSSVTVGGSHRFYRYLIEQQSLYLLDNGRQWIISDITRAPSKSTSTASSGRILAPMDGCVTEVHVKPGARVSRGETLAVMEAMKMEHPLKAACEGTVLHLATSPGDQVRGGQLLVEIDSTAAVTDLTPEA